MTVVININVNDTKKGGGDKFYPYFIYPNIDLYQYNKLQLEKTIQKLYGKNNDTTSY